MKLTIVSIYDDNFGDMLVRICFRELAKAAARLGGLDLEIRETPIFHYDAELIRSSDCVVFPGGGIFGHNYGGFFEPVQEIVDLADIFRIPVYFSSVGYNNGAASEKNDAALRQLMEKKCIKKITVREDPAKFISYLPKKLQNVSLVCDPVTWAGAVFSRRFADKPRKLLGINVVRGGIFTDNHLHWKLKDETAYVQTLIRYANIAGMDYRLYTNGSTLDTNTMLHIARTLEIPEEKLVHVHSSLDLVRAIHSFDMVAATRMHSSILCYGLSVPAVNLVWNEKIPEFYRNIGRPDAVVRPSGQAAHDVFEKLQKLPAAEVSETYLMSLYISICGILGIEPAADYQTLCETLGAYDPAADVRTDQQIQWTRSETRYLKLFDSRDVYKEQAKKLQQELGKIHDVHKEAALKMEQILKELEALDQ